MARRNAASDRDVLGTRFSRRALLQATGVATVGALGARAALAGTRPLGGPIAATAEAIGQDAIDGLAASLDYDLTRIFRHVADEVWYEPYAGSLRGANGALESRAGNSVDKAALLAALLRSALIDTRFVVGRLADSDAATVLAMTAVARDAARARAQAILTGGVDGAVSPQPSPPAGLPPELQSIADRQDELVATAQTWATDHLDSGVGTIVQALAGAGIALPTPAASLPEPERLRHVWVQARQGSDWIDLDPTIPGAQAGQAAATPDGEPTAALPDDLRYQIRLTLTADVISGEELTQQSVLDATLTTDALGPAAMTLIHEKPDGLKSVGISISAALGGGDPHYQAMLVVGNDIHVGTSLVALSGNGSQLLGGSNGSRDGAAVAEWLDVAVTGPDGVTRTTRRPIFDLVEPDARAAGTVDIRSIPEPELVSLGPDAADEFLPLRDIWYLSVATGALSIGGLDTPGDTELDEVASTGLSAPFYHVARDATNALLALDRGVRTFLDGPNVTAFAMGASLNPDGTFDVRNTTDLLHRSFGTLPVSDVAVGAPAGVVAGVLSHVVERAQAGEGVGDLGVDEDPLPPPVSAGSIIEAAQEQDIGLLVLQGAPPSDLAWPAAVTARLADALASGWLAIAPATPVTVADTLRLGWWLVDPVTGATIDQLDTGGGQTMADYGAALRNIWTRTRPYLCLGITVAERVHLIHDLVEGHLGGALIGVAAGAGAHKLLGCH